MPPTTVAASRAIAVTSVWLVLSEFVRNELLLPARWDAHYATLGLVFPRDPLNIVVWIVWSLVFAVVIYALTRRFTLTESVALAWLAGFVMMWLVTWNLSVLPLSILAFAIPLSLLEVGVAALLCLRLAPRDPLRTP